MVMVVIAEKPSLARAIRDALPPDPARTVVAARGHLLEPAPPDDYLPDALPRTKKGKGGKVWRWQDLPILPSAAGGWRKRPRMGARKQITEIRSALASAERVVNAGDPDREGQLLIDEIIAHCGYRGPVDRVWLQSLTPEAIRAAFGTLRPNAAYQPLSRAAEARQRADWVVGMNLTRAWTLSAGRLLSVGRVQTPTLALVVARDREIEEFRPHDFFEVHAGLRAAAGGFVARWRPTNTDGPGFDPEGRLIDRAAAERIVARARAARRGAIIEYHAEKKARAAPLPYSLSSLQQVASARLGLGAQQVLDAAQALYERKLTTYPRTDCRYLSDDQYAGVRAAAARLSLLLDVAVDELTPSPEKHPAFNGKKVTAHTAIVPTGERADGLTGAAAQVYDLIVRATVALFLPAQRWEQVTAMVDLADERWVATGKRVIEPGWTVLYGQHEQHDDGAGASALAIPPMKAGEPVECAGAEAIAKKTTPPARYTEGTLVDAMSHVHRYVRDPAARARLKETSGLGTEATRAWILETLFARGWIERKGKTVVSTPAGRAAIASLPAELTDPVMTARWEDSLSDIAAGRADAAEFERRIAEFVRASLSRIPPPTPRAVASGPTAVCPVCGHTARRLESQKKPGVHYWACQNRAHGLLTDANGKPGQLFARASKPKKRKRAAS